jgi:hypothetical protein
MNRRGGSDVTTKWIKSITAFVLSASLLILSTPLITDAESVAVKYLLTGTSIKVEIKIVLNERISEGTRIGAVVRFYNEGSKVVRVPDYELRVYTSNKIEYTLLPSKDNVKVIQPKENVELSYMFVVRRVDAFTLSKLSWIKVNEFVYPKKQQTMLSIPISSASWPIKEWRESFKIPSLSTSLKFTPLSVFFQNTPQGKTYIVTVAIENTGKNQEFFPSFNIYGKTNNKIYEGVKIEKDSTALLPGEQQQIHYAIQTENNVQLQSLNVLTSERFAESVQSVIQYNVVRLSIKLPSEKNIVNTINQLLPNDFSKPISFDPSNKLISQDVSVSLVDIRMHKSEGDGFSTVIAKFKLENRGDRNVPIPIFQAQLTSEDGHNYLGIRHNITAESLAPDLSYVISYFFNVPNSEKGDNLAMTILDNQTAPPYQLPLAAFRTFVNKETSDSLYPYQVKVVDWTMMTGTSLKINLDIQRQENMMVDPNFTKLKLQLINSSGSVIGTKTMTFIGNDRLTSGWQTISFGSPSSTQIEYPSSLQIYESIDTPFGEADRLLVTLKR